ncbi:uncharacterized protein N7482_000119 [Penicillium canariense]|uniref:Uncharacterized protein n=1 Tax=Penicillium canariense TaxID=189055 RepID=A0A9W9LSU4_9EURO|nr:uncharacterized protein N7482_000119 [Penicillium canariense]KAJ5174242.1 hypothetical protein N7482_000119 [Penicillium canariense]
MPNYDLDVGMRAKEEKTTLSNKQSHGVLRAEMSFSNIAIANVNVITLTDSWKLDGNGSSGGNQYQPPSFSHEHANPQVKI